MFYILEINRNIVPKGTNKILTILVIAKTSLVSIFRKMEVFYSTVKYNTHTDVLINYII